MYNESRINWMIPYFRLTCVQLRHPCTHIPVYTLDVEKAHNVNYTFWQGYFSATLFRSWLKSATETAIMWIHLALQVDTKPNQQMLKWFHISQSRELNLYKLDWTVKISQIWPKDHELVTNLAHQLQGSTNSGSKLHQFIPARPLEKNPRTYGWCEFPSVLSVL